MPLNNEKPFAFNMQPPVYDDTEEIYSIINAYEAKPKTEFVGGLKAIGRQLLTLPEETLSAAASALQGQSGVDLADPDFLDKVQMWVGKRRDEREMKESETLGNQQIIPGVKTTDVTSGLGQSLAFSGVTAGTGIGTGVATGGVAGTGVALGTAYRMASNQIMRQYLTHMNDAKIKEKGQGLTNDEEEALKAEFSDRATKYGIWEAVPEVAGGLIGLKVLTTPLKKMIGKNVLVKGLAKAAGVVLPEIGEETVTQIGQSQTLAGTPLQEGKVLDFNVPGIVEAAKQVAPQTVLISALMGGVGGVAVNKYNAKKASLLKEMVNKEQGHKILDDEKLNNIYKNFADIVESRPNDKELQTAYANILGEIERRKTSEPVKEMPKEAPKEMPKVVKEQPKVEVKEPIAKKPLARDVIARMQNQRLMNIEAAREKYGLQPTTVAAEPIIEQPAQKTPSEIPPSVASAETQEASGQVSRVAPERTVQGEVIAPKLSIREYSGIVGRKDHTTRIEEGTVPTESIVHLKGEIGEKRGEHRNKKGKEWESFKADIKKNGIKNPLFILKDPGKEAVISEGNHRLDAAVELGLKEVPVEIKYFGHSEREGLAYEKVKPEAPNVLAEAKPEMKPETKGEQLWYQGQRATKNGVFENKTGSFFTKNPAEAEMYAGGLSLNPQDRKGGGRIVAVTQESLEKHLGRKIKDEETISDVIQSATRGEVPIHSVIKTDIPALPGKMMLNGKPVPTATSPDKATSPNAPTTEIISKEGKGKGEITPEERIRLANEKQEKTRREWIDKEREKDPTFAPDVESRKELLSPEQLKEVNEYEELLHKATALDRKNKYKPYKLTKKETARFQELHSKYRHIFTESAPKEDTETLSAIIKKAIQDKPSGVLLEYENKLADDGNLKIVVPKGKRISLENTLYENLQSGSESLGGKIAIPEQMNVGEQIFNIVRPYGTLSYNEATGELSATPSEAVDEMVVEKKVKFGVDKTLLLQTISKDIVNNDLANTIANETIQNSLDSFIVGQADKTIRIDVKDNYDDVVQTTKVIIEDNGKGMTQNEVEKNLLRLGAKGKAGTTTRGGYGLAKAGFLLTPRRAKITTIKDGVQTVLSGTREQFFGLKGAGDPITQTSPTTEPNGTRFELDFFSREDEAEKENAFALSSYGAQNAFQKYIKEGVLDDGITFIYKDRYSEEEKSLTTKNPKNLENIFKSQKIRVDKNEATIYFIKDDKPKQRSWDGKFYPKSNIYNKGLALFSLKDILGIQGLLEKPDWQVFVDFSKTEEVVSINYPFIRNRTNLNADIKEQIEKVINERIKSINEKEFKGKKADFDKMVNDSPIINGIKVLIPFKDKIEFDKTSELISQNEGLVSDLAGIFKSFQSVLNKVGDKALNLAITVDPKVHGYRSNPEVTGHEIYAINPFAATQSLKMNKIFAELLSAEYDENTALASNLVHTLVHEYTHDSVQRHDESFTSALANAYVKITHTQLSRLEQQARGFYEKHGKSLEQLQNNFGDMGKGGSQLRQDNLTVSTQLPDTGRKGNVQGVQRDSAKYSLGVANENLTSLTEADVKDVFKWADSVKKNEDGTFSVFKNGQRITVESVAHIAIDDAIFKANIGRQPSQAEKATGARGSKKGLTIQVSRIGDKWTLAHESYHMLEDAGFVNQIDVIAINQALHKEGVKSPTFEDRASWVEKNLKDRANKPNALAKALQKIQDLIDSFVNLFQRTARGVIKDIESGKIGESKDNLVTQEAEAYSLASPEAYLNETKEWTNALRKAWSSRGMYQKNPGLISKAFNFVFGSPEWSSHPVMQALSDTFIERSAWFNENFKKFVEGDHPETKFETMNEALDSLNEEQTDKFAELDNQFDTSGFTQNEARAYMKKNNIDPAIQEVWEAKTARMNTVWDAHIAPIEREINEIEARAMTFRKEPSYPIVSYEIKYVEDSKGNINPVFDKTKPITIKDVLEIMREIKTYAYSPRLREQGAYAVRGFKTAEGREFMRFEKNLVAAEKLKAELIKDGWGKVYITESNTFPESVLAGLKEMDVAKLIQAASDKNDKEAVSEVFTKEISEAVHQIILARGYRRHTIARQDKLVEGYETDPRKKLFTYFTNSAAGLAKSKAARQVMDIMLGGINEGSPEGYRIAKILGEYHKNPIKANEEARLYDTAKKYISDNLRNIDEADRMIATVKKLATFKYLSWTLRAPLVNTTALLTTVLPSIHQYCSNGEKQTKQSFMRIIKEIGIAGGQYAKIMASQKNKGIKAPELAYDEQAFIDDINRSEYDDPQMVRDMMTSMQASSGKMFDNIVQWGMIPFKATEQWMRGLTMLAGYRIAKANGLSTVQAQQAAIKAAGNAHGIYGKATRQYWAQGTDVAARIGQVATTFLKFPQNYLNLLYDLGWDKGNIKAFTWALAAPVVLGGAVAIPFYSNVVWMINAIMKALGDDRDIEKMVYDDARLYLGKEAEKNIRTGLMGAAGIDVTGSLSMGIGLPTDLLSLTGIFGAMAKETTRAGHFISTKQYSKALETALPSGVANLFRAVRELDGATTSTGARVWNENGTPYIPDVSETTLRILGFRSSERTTTQQRQWESQREEQRFGETRNKIYERYRAYLSKGKPSPKEQKEILNSIYAYNKAVYDSGRAGLVPFIGRGQLTRQARAMVVPSKKERMRMIPLEEKED